jgi:HTH-type transcriptional regulator/antitoxin MqsA
MTACDVCGGLDSRMETVSEVFEVNGRRVLVGNIPVQVCMQCGEMSFSRETAEKVRRLVHGDAQPVGVVQMELFEFA